MMKSIVYTQGSAGPVRQVFKKIPSLASMTCFQHVTNVFSIVSMRLASVMGSFVLFPMICIASYIPESFPNLYSHHVLVKVKNAGLNPCDAKFLYGDKISSWMVPFLRLFLEGKTVGLEFSGIVCDTPPLCPFKIGDEVFGTVKPFGDGTFQEYIRVGIDSIVLKPRNLSFAQAACLPLVGLTSIECFEDHHLQAGQHLLVIGGSGGAGHVAIQIAKAMNVRVTAICSGKNASYCRQLGADHVICYDQSSSLEEDLQQTVALHGPFQLVLDTVTSIDTRDASWSYQSKILRHHRHPPDPSTQSPSMSQSATPLLTASGKYMRLGGSVYDWWLAHVKRFVGWDWFPKDSELFWVRLTGTTVSLSKLKDLCEKNDIVPTLAYRLPMTAVEVKKGFALQMSRRVVGKICVDVMSSDTEPQAQPQPHAQAQAQSQAQAQQGGEKEEAKESADG